MTRWIVITVLLAGTYQVAAQNNQQLIGQGNQLYKQKQYQQAAGEYMKAAENDKDDPRAQYNLGNAFYRGNQWDKAESAFAEAARAAQKEDIKANAHYNHGVSLSRQKKVAESIDAYKNALRLAPDDQQARENLQKALNELKQQQQQQQQQNNQNQDQQKQPQQQDKQQPPQNKSNINQKRADQLLNSLRQEEKAIQDKMQRKNNPGTTPEKDW